MALVGYKVVTVCSGWIQGGHNELWLDTGVTMSSDWIQGGHNELWLATGWSQ